MTDTKATNLFHGVLEIVTAHQLLKYIKEGDDSAKLRIATGGGMAALGYIYGPDLLERLQKQDYRFSEDIGNKFMYVAGGAIAGGVIGNLVMPGTAEKIEAPKIIGRTSLEKRVEQDIIQKPHPFIVAVSTGYLAYALFMNGKDEEQRKQHWIMLGSGAVGYAYGPEIIERTKSMTLSNRSVNDALDKYNQGAIIGSIGGALVGYLKGKDIHDWVKRAPHEDTD